MAVDFLLTFPVYVVGIRAGDALVAPIGRKFDDGFAVAVFTEELHAERARDLYSNDSSIVKLSDSGELIQFLQQVKESERVTHVTTDPIESRQAVLFEIEGAIDDMS